MRYDAKSKALTLTDHDTHRYASDALFRANVRELLRAYARRAGVVCYLYAAPTCGGYPLEEAAPPAKPS
jgi:hypothetical protein